MNTTSTSSRRVARRYSGPPIIIESHIPVPAFEGEAHTKAKSRTYPFDMLKPGDSFGVNKDHKETYRNVYQSMCGYRKKYGGRFVVREVLTDDRRIEVRCWRLTDEVPADA